ncbi:HAD family hydrolase [Marinilactibacillus psychrotolerans]|uniref:Beta-phosphoglucomutase n=1 Tax=Marinilactibacillus psychrotolerans TaxID=191770 RepID=A0AAV3W957_9LACT|nr:HAD family phosphatase [Marinilactibacillus psychrotolerans]GEL66737.1 pesticidal protein Cry10Aa [Marinilactibacillus psychrotolerans]GEQ35816.1 beta-phosphoglucomutase [Marinilactibacillus psychrotolerans]SDC32181.1 haloacid dehalogenase superfamily, subfamily IA, variant 3 with third motif having DD or ED [Marinilactibacillus psychrotolerans]
MKGIIFDFNGTMFQDSPFHEQAWIYIIKKYSTKVVTNEDILHKIHGQTNDKILTYFLNGSLSQEKIILLSNEKEAYYRKLVLNQPDLALTEGLEEILNNLHQRNTPMTIATASPKQNLEFYYSLFNLDRWFDKNKIVYDDGSFPGKPCPDIFILAAQRLNLLPKDCLVIEDAISGLKAAMNAGIGTIIAIDPEGHNQPHFDQNKLSYDGIITNFNDFADYL